jgi:uncharacterized protein YydD (DUF2326 family)
MHLKQLRLEKATGEIIQDIIFQSGLNLIVDNTPSENSKETGNNVGKTTVLKLVDFCLGGKAKYIYTEPENLKNEYKLVKDFLIENEVLVTLWLTTNLHDPKAPISMIERNFLLRSKRIQRFNGIERTDDEFEECLTDLLFPGTFGKKPTFRQIIAHNIRYSDLSLINTLKILDRYTRDDEYETLYLFLFGCDYDQGDSKQELRTKIDLEEKFKNRLEKQQTKSAYAAALEILNSEISELEKKRTLIQISPSFESDIDELNEVKFKLNQKASEISNVQLRINIISEASEKISLGRSDIDVTQLRQIYEQATSLISPLQKSFEDLMEFHNTMVDAKVRFIEKDLPDLQSRLQKLSEDLRSLETREVELNSRIVQGDLFVDLEHTLVELNDLHQKKGEYESVIAQLDEVEDKLGELNSDLAKIDEGLFSVDSRKTIQDQLNKFNRHFSNVSFELYGERYAVKFDEKEWKGRRVYEFTAFNTNFSTGKKQGEITCFDIAYTLFADEEDIPCMHFLLNDKKELMHGNQLLKIGSYVASKNIQMVTSILRDKLPNDLVDKKNIILELSQREKLFRIEDLTSRST